MKNTDEAYDADHGEGKYGELLGELIHAQLKRCALFFYLLVRSLVAHEREMRNTYVLHHGEDDSKLGLSARGYDNTGPPT